VTGGFSIVLLIPLLQLLSIGAGEATEGVALFIQNLADRAGIELTIGSILLVYMVLLTLTALLQYWKALLDARYQQTFIYTLRRRLFRKIIMADWQLLNSRSKTNHLQVLTREVPNCANYYFFYLKLLTTLIMTAAYTLYAMWCRPDSPYHHRVGIIVFFLLRRFLMRSFARQGVCRLLQPAAEVHRRLWQTVK
jgi:ATP-binding cassette subfamily C protein